MRNPKMTASSSSGSVASRVLTGVKKDRDSKHDLDFVKTFRNMNQRMNKLLGEPLPADVKCKSLNWIRRTVREQYANKMVADAVDDRIHNLRALPSQSRRLPLLFLSRLVEPHLTQCAPSLTLTCVFCPSIGWRLVCLGPVFFVAPGLYGILSYGTLGLGLLSMRRRTADSVAKFPFC